MAIRVMAKRTGNTIMPRNHGSACRGKSEKALIIKEVVSEDSDAKKMPGEGAPPRRDWQNQVTYQAF